MREVLKKVILIVLCAVSGLAQAQDLHFSQWFNAPLMTNPANTGFIPDADYRIGANYRNQWSSIMSIPYKTFGVWGDAQVFRNQIESGWMGIGGAILRDAAGSGTLTTTRAYASVAYHQMLGEAHLLSIGFNAGWSNKRINNSALKFPDQFDGRFFDNTLPTSVQLDRNSTSYFDFQAGLNYAYFPTDRLYLNGGISVMHLNRPRESFFTNDQPGFDSRIPLRITGFANASIKMSDDLIINPLAYYSTQAGASELVAGGFLQYNLSGDGEQQLLGGVFARLGDALVPMVGFEWNHIRLTFTYDATMSSLKQFNQTRGAYEFALLRHGFYDEYNSAIRQTICPSFR